MTALQISMFFDGYLRKEAFDVPQKYLDMYETFDKGHGPAHREAVRAFAETLADRHAPDRKALITAAAQLHDIGISVEREGHAEHGRRLLEADPEFQKQFNLRELKALLSAVANHGSTGKPRSTVARIVSDADKASEAGPGHLYRAYEWGRVYEPQLSDDENLVRSLRHIKEKFGTGGPGSRLFFPESRDHFNKEMSSVFDLDETDIPAIRAVVETERVKQG